MFIKLRLGVLALLSLLLVACSSGKIIKTYEGEALANEQVAVLTAPDNISLISVNGKRVPKYLLSTINVNYGLKPGVNVVVFEYESVWAVPKKGDSLPSELVQSGRKEVVIDALAGERYNFTFDQVENLAQARELASNFVAELVDSHANVVATSTDQGVYAPPVVTPSNQGLTGQAMVSNRRHDDNRRANSDLPTLEALKVLWKRASADDKKAFLEWAFEK